MDFAKQAVIPIDDYRPHYEELIEAVRYLFRFRINGAQVLEWPPHMRCARDVDDVLTFVAVLGMESLFHARIIPVHI